MVQATTKSYNLQPETRFSQEQLGPEMMMMKRTKLRRKLKDNNPVSQSGKSPNHDLAVKVTSGSPNYMKGTSSSEARKENKKRLNQTGPKHDSRIVMGLTKATSFKRCSQRATCSSTLKDSKFPEYLMLNHGENGNDEVDGTSVLKVCPYTYCSLNGHLHASHPPLKSFISSRRRSLKSQKNVKMEGYKEEIVEIYVEEKKECEKGDGESFEVYVETQISETFSEGAPRSEVDSDEYSDSSEMVKYSDSEDNVADDSMEEIQETCEVDADEYSDSVEMVKYSEGDHELKESDLEETHSMEEIQETCEVDAVTEEAPCSEAASDYSDSVEMVKFSECDHGTELQESDLEETLVDDSVEEIQEKGIRDGYADQSACFTSEVISLKKNSEAKDDAGEEILEDKTEDYKEESQEQIEVISMIKETTKVPFNRTERPCKQEELDANISWTITKGKKPVEETEDLRGFNPREPNYLPIVPEADGEKVDLKHQEIDERRNSEDWMFDYALQRTVTKLSSARKRKVALLVEAFETVQPVTPNGKEPAPVLSYGRHLQACN